MNGDPYAPTSPVQALDRAVSILGAFTHDHPVRGVTEIARAVGLSPATTHRLLTSLTIHELIRRVGTNGKYALGPGVLRLAASMERSTNLEDVALPSMEWLRDQTEETTALHVASASGMRIVLRQVESRHALRRTYTELGRPVPIHEGAPGKLLLAHAPLPIQQAVLAPGELARATPNTICDSDALAPALAEIRECGYATSFEERIVGISTIAAPVRDHRGGVVAAISVSGPAIRMSPERMQQIRPLLLAACDRISSLLGHRVDLEDA